jgi:hypothetical protein
MGNEIQVKSIARYKPLNKYVGLEGKFPIVGGYTYIGVEIELENISKTECRNISGSTWQNIEDGSLKVRGREFVTVPIKAKYIEVELDRLFSGLKEPVASSRCSVHIHINVREMTLQEIGKFMILYSIFERSLYRFTGDRWNSNFCVPLYASPYYPKQLLTQLFMEGQSGKNMNFSWYKYFGFNICPIFGLDGSNVQGTIEFRHLKGTTDTKYIINWINLIISLKIFSKKYDVATLEGILLTMNSDSSYIELCHSIFGKYSNLLLNQPTFKEDVESCVTATKNMCFDKNKVEDKIEIKFKG